MSLIKYDEICDNNISRQLNDVLPAEILSRIFELYFSVDELVEKLSKVCHLWRQIIHEGFASRKYLHFTNKARKLVRDDSRVFKAVTHLYVKIVDLSRLGILYDLTRLFERLTNLTELNIVCSLEHVDKESIKNLQYCFSLLACNGCGRLRRVEVSSSVDTLPASTVASIILQQLSLSNASDLRELVYRHVTLSFYGGRRSVLPVLQRFANLQVLHLSQGGLGAYNTRLGEIIPSVPHITHLDIRQTRIATNDTLINRIAEHCPQIKFLGLSSRIEACADSFNNLMHSAIRLTRVMVDECIASLHTVNSVYLLLQICTEFKVLRCEGLSSALLHRLFGVKVDSLVEVDVYGSRNAVSDRLLAQIAVSFPGIQTVVISSCNAVTNAGVAGLVHALCGIRVIHAHGARNITSGLLDLLADEDRMGAAAVDVIVSRTPLAEEMGQQSTTTGRYGNICLRY